MYQRFSHPQKLCLDCRETWFKCQLKCGHICFWSHFICCSSNFKISSFLFLVQYSAYKWNSSTDISKIMLLAKGRINQITQVHINSVIVTQEFSSPRRRSTLKDVLHRLLWEMQQPVPSGRTLRQIQDMWRGLQLSACLKALAHSPGWADVERCVWALLGLTDSKISKIFTEIYFSLNSKKWDVWKIEKLIC